MNWETLDGKHVPGNLLMAFYIVKISNCTDKRRWFLVTTTSIFLALNSVAVLFLNISCSSLWMPNVIIKLHSKCLSAMFEKKTFKNLGHLLQKGFWEVKPLFLGSLDSNTLLPLNWKISHNYLCSFSSSLCYSFCDSNEFICTLLLYEKAAKEAVSTAANKWVEQ